MSISGHMCCYPFVTQLGMPDDFIRATVGNPATTLAEYEDQLATLQDKLRQAEACEHYRKFTKDRLGMLCGHDLLDHIEAAEFIRVSPREYEDLFPDCLEDSTPDPSM